MAPSSPRTSGISSKLLTLAIRIPHHRHITYNNLILHLLIHRILLSQGRDTLLTAKEGEEYERILTAMYTRSGTRAGGARTNWQQAEAPAAQHVTTRDGRKLTKNGELHRYHNYNGGLGEWKLKEAPAD
jgi:hypothetical protein